MRGAIDIGSNTVRLLIGEKVQDKIEVCCGRVITTRLAAKDRRAPLSLEAKNRTLAALLSFQKILQEWQVTEPPRVIATSAMREAADGAVFAEEIRQKTGWPVQILTGEEEAAFSYHGAASVARRSCLVLDVGGGSTELAWETITGKITGKSLPIGAVRLRELGQEWQKAELAGFLAPLWEGVPRALPLVGVGGTVTTLAAMALELKEYSRRAVSGYCFGHGELLTLGEAISSLSLAKRRQKWPLLQDREDIILEGLAIVLQVMAAGGITEITVSDAGILDGILLAAE